MSDVKRDIADTRLSYSSYQTVKSCEQKYWHYKVNNTPIDSDLEDEKESLILGKAFHSILEGTKHTIVGLAEVIKTVQDAYQIEADKMALVVAMVKVYLNLKDTHPHFKNLSPVAIELELSDDKMIGFIDVIFKDDVSGNWYIGDLKTAARHSPNIKAKLEMDAQLNLYASYADHIAQTLGLDRSKFAGCLYIVTNKTTTKRKAGEGLSAYVDRLVPAIETKVHVVPMSEDKINWVKNDFLKYHERTNELRNGSEPNRNYSNCEMYFTPCKYFSQCHGHNYSEVDMEVWE